MGKADDIARGSDIFTQSRLYAFRKCPRYHYLKYEIGLHQIETKQALRMGSAFHVGQEELGKIPGDLEGESREKMVQGAVIACIESYNCEPPGSVTAIDWAVERETVGRMLWAYAQFYAKDPIRVLAAEQVFKHPVRNVIDGEPVYKMMSAPGEMPDRMMLYRAGMIDKIGQLPDGRVCILEHKTTGDSIKGDSDYWMRAKISGQVTFYYLAALDSPELEDPQLIYYDVIRKPGIAPRKLTLSEHRNFLGLAYKKGKKTVVPPDAEQHKKYYGEEFVVEIHGVVDNEDPANTDIKSIVIDGAEAKLVKSGNNMVITETPTMFGARLVDDILSRPEMYFAREEIPRLRNDLEECEADIHQTVEMILFCQRTGQWPKNDGSCINPYRCEFMGLCSSGVQVTVDGDVPKGFKVAEYIHPELEHQREVLANANGAPSPASPAGPIPAPATGPPAPIGPADAVPPEPVIPDGYEEVGEDEIPF